MTTIAVSMFGSRVSGRLDCADTFLLVSVQNGMVHERRSVSAPPDAARRILEHLGVDILICGGMTERCVHAFSESRIKVIPWVQGEVDEVLAHFLEQHAEDLPHIGKDGLS